MSKFQTLLANIAPNGISFDIRRVGYVKHGLMVVALCLTVLLPMAAMGPAQATGTTTYSYDALGRLSSVDYGNGVTITYAYDASGNRTGQVVNTTVGGDLIWSAAVTPCTANCWGSAAWSSSGYHAPVAANDSLSSAGSATTFDPRADDSDPDGYTLTITAVGAPSHGTTSINGGTSITYTPTSGYSGSDSFTYTISDGHGGSATATVSVTVTATASPPTGSLSASPTAIASGGSSTLSWSSSNATSAEMTPSIGPVSTAGSITVSPTVTTTYSLALSGVGGTTVQHVTVTVVPPPTGSLSASPTSVASGGSSTLSWTSSNATSASISGIGAVTPAGGSVTVSPTATTIYTLTLTGIGGTALQGVAVIVVPPPSGTFSPSPASIGPGGSSTLSWTSSNATSASISGVGAVSPVSGGSVSVSPTATTTYTLTLTGTGGTSTQQATVAFVAGNQPPVANNILVAYAQVSPPYGPWMATTDVRNYDSDPDGDTLSVTNVGTASGCTISSSGPMIITTATVSPRVTCTVPYTVSDGYGHTASALITIHP